MQRQLYTKNYLGTRILKRTKKIITLIIFRWVSFSPDLVEQGRKHRALKNCRK